MKTFYPHCVGDELNERYIFALKHREVVEGYLTALNTDIDPRDALSKANAWLKIMRKLDPQLEERQKIKAEFSDIFSDFIDGKIVFETFIKKHKKAVKKYAKFQFGAG